MRFMMIVKANDRSEGGCLPDEAMLAQMNQYNRELESAGVLIDLNGLQPSSKGSRLIFKGGRAVVTNGPFAETKELVAGYWLIKAKSKEEAVEWASRAPMLDGDEIEIRQVFEFEDFPSVPDEVKEAHDRVKAAR